MASQNTSLEGDSIKRTLSEIVEVLSRQESRQLSDTKVCKRIRKSLMEGLSLEEYVMAKEAKCLQEHTNC